MASYDFNIKVRNETEEAFLRRLLHGLQLRCRQRWVTVHYRRDPAGYYVTVDGPLTNIQSSIGPITIALSGMLDAVPTSMTRPRRVQVGGRIVRGYVRGAWDITVSVLDMVRAMGLTPNSYYFDAVDHPVVQYRLDSVTSILQAWNNEDASSEQVLEELHAIAELLMGFILGGTWDDRAFSDQAAEMVRTNRLSQRDHDVLIDLKNRRRAVRHHRAAMRRDELAAILPNILAALHAVVARVS